MRNPRTEYLLGCIALCIGGWLLAAIHTGMSYPGIPDSCRKAAPPLNPLDTCTTLADSIACWGIPFPDVFERIAWVETGAGTAGVGELNNLFGMRCHSRATQDSCHHSGYGVYASREDAIADLALWVQYSPALPGETAYEYLLRRGWQPRAWMPKYWQALNDLNH